jgi:hypothetical protein
MAYFPSVNLFSDLYLYLYFNFLAAMQNRHHYGAIHSVDMRAYKERIRFVKKGNRST